MAYGSAVALTVKEVSRAGLDLTGSTLSTTPTATHGNKFRNNGKTVLFVNNGSASPITITIDTPGTVAGLAINDLTVSVPAGKEYAIGPFVADFNQADGYVWATFSAVTDVKIDAVRLAIE
jgi:hypothetical protein